MTSQTELTDSNKALLDEMIAQMSPADLEKAQKMVSDWKPEPTALTIKAKGGITEAEVYLLKAR